MFVRMSSKKRGGKKGEIKEQVAVGDTFNETEDDKTHRVIEVHPERDPPVALCHSIKQENESTETEQEYALKYVENCVETRREFDKMGFNNSDVYDIYQMFKTKLKLALSLAKQTTTGSRQQLRDRLCYFRGIGEVPSDVGSGPASDSDDITKNDSDDKHDSDGSLPGFVSPSSSDDESTRKDSDSDSDSDYVPKPKKKVSKQTESRAASAVLSDGDDTDDSMPEPERTDESDESSSDDDDGDLLPARKKTRSEDGRNASASSASAAASKVQRGKKVQKDVVASKKASSSASAAKEPKQVRVQVTGRPIRTHVCV